MQSMKNATKQLNKLVWPRRLRQIIGAALRPSNVGCGDAHEFSAWPAQCSRPTFIVFNPVTTIDMSLFD